MSTPGRVAARFHRLATHLAGSGGIEALYTGILWVAGALAAVMTAVSVAAGVGPAAPVGAAIGLAIAGLYILFYRVLVQSLPSTGRRRAWALSLLDVTAGMGLFYVTGANAGWAAPLRLLMTCPAAARLPLRHVILLAAGVGAAVAGAPFLPPFTQNEAYAFYRLPQTVAIWTLGCGVSTVIAHFVAWLYQEGVALVRQRDALLLAERAARREAEQHNQELAALVDVTRAISEHLSPETVLAEVRAQLARVLPFDFCFIALRDPLPDGGSLRYLVCHACDPQPPAVCHQPSALSPPTSDFIPEPPVVLHPEPPASEQAHVLQVLATGEPLLVQHTTEEIARLEAQHRHQAGITTSSATEPASGRVAASLLYAPLRAADITLGVLSAQSYALRAYTRRHATLLEAIGQQVAIALHNASLTARLGEAEALRSLSGMQDQLIATASHELRTPLTYIYGYSELLSTGSIPSNHVPQLVKEIHKAAQHMRDILDDLLDLERLQGGQIALDRDPVDVRDVVSDALTLLGPRIEQHEIVVELPSASDGGDTSSQVPLLWADRHRTVQVLVNLLENAVRYSPAGSVVRIGAQASGPHHVAVWVQDEGAGLTPNQRERIFDKFYRGPIELTGRHPGAGLGLSISRGLVEAHGRGCRIWAESDGPGKGSRFTFTLPAAPPEAAAPSLALNGPTHTRPG